MQSRRFIQQALDPEYGHPAFETMFVVERPEELRIDRSNTKVTADA